ncbi:hypothetical protein HC761_00910, partial [bacterium]|nr:hypothetical protein [bacterium]
MRERSLLGKKNGGRQQTAAQPAALAVLAAFTALAVLGWVIDVRLRRVQPVATPTLPWIVAFYLWAIIGTAVIVPDRLIQRVLEMTNLFVLYGTIAHGVQRLRTFQLVAGVMAGTCMFIAIVCFHQGLSPNQCIAGHSDAEGDIAGTPDGRPCDNVEMCRGPDAEPGMEYRCERVGMFGTFSVEDRVRYRGELHDPNEVSLTIAAGALSLLIAFALRTRTSVALFWYVIGVAVAAYTIFLTKSRGGQICALLVPFVYMVRRWGIKAFIPAGMAALPVLLL